MLSGIALQGQSLEKPLSRDSINLALSYGAEAMDLIEVYKRQIDNLKAEVDQIYGVADNRELQVEVLTGAVEKMELRKPWWRKLWDGLIWFFAGAAAAAFALTI